MHIDDLETPVAVVDLDKLEANITGLQQYLDKYGIVNRPHIKTHKIPEIAWMQINAGAVGITCQKLGEAEVMAQAGIRDIFLPYNIIGETKLEHLIRLARRIKISVTADSAFVVHGLSEAARHTASDWDPTFALPVFVEFDTGLHRCGVQTPAEAAELARLIKESPNLHFAGLMTYPSNVDTDPFVQQTKTLLQVEGIAVESVSGGGTPTMWQAHTHSEVTEHRAGTYVYGDRNTIAAGAMRVKHCALQVMTTVVSRPTAERGILDAGSKTLSSDKGGLEGYGLILEYPDARIYKLSEEHGFVDFSQCAHQPEIGERVTVIPNHCCVVSNLFNQIIGIRKDTVEVVWPVAARGMLQ
ncbi:MAG: D-TA family PLP-dependent enzyme [Anaerolineae bacterium]|nr:D-TA family PLP-dependent enzyme [Anaerolineae bacterium]